MLGWLSSFSFFSFFLRLLTRTYSVDMAVSVSYRSVGNGPKDEEVGLVGTNSILRGGDSIGGSTHGYGTTRRVLKPRLIFGKAWR